MSFLKFLPLISCFFVLTLGFFVLAKKSSKAIKIIFFLFCLVVSVWLFGTFMMFRTTQDYLAIFWDRFIYAGVVFVPALMHHFSLLITKRKNQRLLLYTNYGLAFVFLFLSQTKYFVDGLFYYAWGVHTKAQFFHHIFLFQFFFFIFFLFYNIYTFYKNKANALEKAQLKYVLLAFGLLIGIGAFAYLPAYGISIFPFSFISGVLFAVVLVYAILHHRFMDIKIAIKHGSIYVGSIIVTVALTFSLWLFLNKLVYSSDIGTTVTSLIFALIIFSPLNKFIEKFANKHLFYSLYNYQETINHLTNKLTTIINLDQIIDLVVDTIKNTMRLVRSGVLLIDESKSPFQYQVAKVVGFNKKNGISLVQDNFLTRHLAVTQKPLVREELDFLSEQTKSPSDKQSFLTLKEHMTRIEASLCLPLISSNKLTGIIVLGGKVSGDAYSKEDLDLLTVLSNQASIAIENARLYQQVQDFNKTLQTKVDEQTKDIQEKAVHLEKLLKMRSEFLDIASHQLRTPTSVIKGTLAMMKEGDMEKMSPEEKAKFVEGMFQKSVKLESIINDILMASEMDTADFDIETKDEIELDKFLEKEVNEHQFDAAEKKLTLAFEKLTAGPFKIKGSIKYLEQVIDNLLDNALKYTPQGFVKATIKKEGNNAIIAISDSGIGILKDDLKRIFNKFIRGKNARNVYTDGSGLGLFIIKRIMDRHPGSKVWAESPVRQALTAGGEESKGSTFYLQFPLLK